ncbi:Rossmann-like and DUF2520 domain-containing protein [Salegentibacter chungangensis]|uniref:Rossmann-like and DUF2520 domain-containing protein n=1 Tax=Salegentibacter chungangensis TaxID=1335724 RepID=A0ABW3NSR4_9FLAO
MINVILLGAGNVATHLFRAFRECKNVNLIQVYNHKAGKLKDFQREVATTTDLSKLKTADFYVLALKDDAINEVAEGLHIESGVVLHTSGGKDMKLLSRFQEHGVFYPLQTFSKNRNLNFREIPICLEASSPKVLGRVRKLAVNISDNIYEIDSESRRRMHVAAVFANNFTNHLYELSSEICEENGIEFDILKPLIRETASKIESLSPKEAQTGPAIRNDQHTIQTHLDLLNEDQQKIYKTLTSSIQKTYGKKL